MILPPSPRASMLSYVQGEQAISLPAVNSDPQALITPNSRCYPVKPQRHHFRHEDVSLRHRKWGFNCPCVDLDLVLVEYHVGFPVALVDYKDRHAQEPDLRHPTIRALQLLADNSAIPFLIAFYDNRTWAFRVIPVNDLAHKSFDSPCEILSERKFVERLYHLRHLTVEREVFAALNSSMEYDGNTAQEVGVSP